MSLNKIVKKGSPEISSGVLRLESMSAEVFVHATFPADSTVRILINNMWLDAEALRKSAKLFNRLADALDLGEA